MGIDSGALVLALLNGVKISEYHFDVFFVLIKQWAFHSLSYSVHFLQTDFFFLLIQSVFIQVLYQFPAILDVHVYLLIMFLTLVGYCNLVRYTYSLEVLDEVAEIYKPSHEITLHIQTP